MPYTPRFGLTTFSNSSEGTITDDGGKYTGRDRLLLDRVLAAFETHVHSGGTQLADPAFTPTGTLQTTGGALAAGTTYYYRVSLVDQYGLETAASDEVSVVMPDPIEVMDPPILLGVVPADAANQLMPGLYTYGFTVVDNSTESTMSPINVITVETGRENVQVTIQEYPAGADQVHIWRMGPTDAVFTRLGYITSATPFIDDGSVPSNAFPCDPFLLPPTENQTNAQNSVVITVDAAAVADDDVSAWRIYRTEVPGVYDAESLVAHVVDTVAEDSNDLVATYTDTGAQLLDGQPLEASQTLQPSALITGGGGGGGRVLVLSAPNGQGWRVICATDGSLMTRQSGITGANVRLTDANSVQWLLDVTDDGALRTTVDTEGVGDLFTDRGPILPTTDPITDWMLRVGIDGALETVSV